MTLEDKSCMNLFYYELDRPNVTIEIKISLCVLLKRKVIRFGMTLE